MSIQPAKPPHNRKLGLLGSSLTKARLNKDSGTALGFVRDELEAALIDSNFFDGTPFSWITLAIRYGLKEESTPHYQAISKKCGDLPLAIEVPIEKLQDASLEELKRIFKGATLKALIHAGEKYGRPVEALKAMNDSLP